MQFKSLFMPSKWVEKAKVLSDRFHGLDFTTVCEPEELGLDSRFAYRSAPSGDKFLVNMLSDFNITTKDSIIDIGCGKGSAMRKILQFPFAQVDGIELSDRLAAIAIQNFKTLNVTRTKIFNCDASLFNDYDAYNFVYLYNPFPSSVMSYVVDSLINSVQRSDRELVIIYNNPTCHEMVVDQNVFAKAGVYPDNWGNSIAIDSNYSGGNSRLSANQALKRTP